MSLLTFIIAVPLAGAVLLALMPDRRERLWRNVTHGALWITFLLAGWAFVSFWLEPGETFRFQQQIPWVEQLGISFHVGADGLNIGLLLMTAAVALAAGSALSEIRQRPRLFNCLFLIMTGGVLGAFASLDVFFFYFFHELALVPTFVMIGIWGRGERRQYAAFKLTIYLTGGALIALVGLVMLYQHTGASSFGMAEMIQEAKERPIPVNQQTAIFGLLLLGFGILVSLWPFHTWAPIGYASAPTATAMLHAGALKKFGLYGLVRLAVPLAPEGLGRWLEIFCLLALGNILYCGWVTMRQRNLHLLIGNSSVAHMGLAFLGIASLSLAGITGAVVIMIAHGLLAALAFRLSGWLEHSKGSAEIQELGGLLSQVPFFGTCLFLALLAACGVPGFANFAGEILVLFGAWDSLPWFAVAGAWGALIIGALYCLRAVSHILHGRVDDRNRGLGDMQSAALKFPCALLIALLLIFGCYPRILTDAIERSVRPLINPASAVAILPPAPETEATNR